MIDCYNDTIFECCKIFTIGQQCGYILHEYDVNNHIITAITRDLYCICDSHNYGYNGLYQIPDNHETINGKIENDYGWIYVQDNLIHNYIGPAVNSPLCKHMPYRYFIYGKALSEYSWLSWVKNGPYWNEVMANILGKQNC